MEQPDWVRRINYLGHSVGGGDQLINLDADELIAIAKMTTGLIDFGGDDWEDDFYHYVEWLNSIANLHTLGRLRNKARLLLGLRNLLFVTDKIKQQPAILKEPIENPLIITGLPRTGTTILFELLYQDSSFRSPLGFEAICPVEPPTNTVTGSVNREKIAQGMIDFIMDIQPDIKAMHYFQYDIPVECDDIIKSGARSILPFFNSSDSYQSWNEKVDNFNIYPWHKKVLKLLQYRQPVKSWLLKSPIHMHYMRQLLESYPNARIIHTHRDPAKSLVSTASIVTALTHLDKEESELSRFQESLQRQRDRAGKVIEQRKKGIVPEKQIADIHFHDLMLDPLATIGQVYDRMVLT